MSLSLHCGCGCCNACAFNYWLTWASYKPSQVLWVCQRAAHRTVHVSSWKMIHMTAHFLSSLEYCLWQSDMLWLLCACQWFFYKTQCFTSGRFFFGICFKNDTTFHSIELPVFVLPFLVAYSLSMGKGCSMHPRASRSLQTLWLWGTVSSVRSYWACHIPGHRQKMWLARSWSSNSLSFFMSLIAQGLLIRQGRSSR